MKKVAFYIFIVSFAFANFACTEVGTNNKVANGEMEVVEEKDDTDKIIEEAIKENVRNKIKAKNEEKLEEQNSPEAVVKNLYKEEENENNPFFQNEKRELVDRFFVKELADLIWKDAVEAGDDVGILEFDPLYDAQDAEVAELKVRNAEIKGGKATIGVSFLNFGEEKNVKYLLTKENGKWKISDIDYGDDSLLKILKEGKREEAEPDEN